MAIQKIVTKPNKILNRSTEKIKKIDRSIRELAQDLIDTVLEENEPEGAGLSANQIGISKRMCVIRNFFENPQTNEVESEEIILINPKMISHSNETDLDWEGCLSVPNVYGKVSRYKKIKVMAKDLENKKIRFKATNFFARTIQHEMDHLNGILFTSKVEGKTISEKQFDNLYNL